MRRVPQRAELNRPSAVVDAVAEAPTGAFVDAAVRGRATAATAELTPAEITKSHVAERQLNEIVPRRSGEWA